MKSVHLIVAGLVTLSLGIGVGSRVRPSLWRSADSTTDAGTFFSVTSILAVTQASTSTRLPWTSASRRST